MLAYISTSVKRDKKGRGGERLSIPRPGGTTIEFSIKVVTISKLPSDRRSGHFGKQSDLDGPLRAVFLST